MNEHRRRSTPEGSGRVWGPAGTLHGVCCLIGLTGGLWAGMIHPSGGDTTSAILPTLRAVAAAQILFFWMVYPLVLLRRRLRPGVSPHGWPVMIEPVVILLTAIPFYVMAAALGNATAGDVLRVVLYIGCTLPVAAATWVWLQSPSARTPVMLVLVTVALAGPAVAYMLLEFVTSGHGVLFRVAPVLRVWALGGRGETFLTRPYWTWLLWPTVGFLMLLAGVARARREAEDPPSFRPGREA